MPQVSVYLDARTVALLDDAARDAGITRSRFVAETLLDRLGAAWSLQVTQLAGAWSDVPRPLTFEQQLAALVEEARVAREARYALMREDP
jgi:hypothetical protein